MAKESQNKTTSERQADSQTTGQEQSAGGSGGATGGRQASGQAAQQQNVEVDDSHIQASYANFCRVSSTPEELILDLGLNPNPYNPGSTPIKLSQRVILNHFTAKRLLNALSVTLQRHEQAFGVLETDVRRRVRQS